MFGCNPFDAIQGHGPRPEDRVDLASAPLHVFTPAPTSQSPAPEAGPRRGGLRGLFGRT